MNRQLLILFFFFLRDERELNAVHRTFLDPSVLLTIQLWRFSSFQRRPWDNRAFGALYLRIGLFFFFFTQKPQILKALFYLLNERAALCLT